MLTGIHADLLTIKMIILLMLQYIVNAHHWALYISILYLFRENENSDTKNLKYFGVEFSEVPLNQTQHHPHQSFKACNPSLLGTRAKCNANVS